MLPWQFDSSEYVLQRLYYLISTLDKTFQLYHKLNPYPIKHLLGDHLSSYKIQSHKLYPGGDVKTILVENDAMFLGLASGLTKKYDLCNYDNFRYPASRFYDPDNGKGVTHLSKNEKYLGMVLLTYIECQ